MTKRGAAIAIFIGVFGCSGFLGDDPGDDPVTVFEDFWENFDRYYAHFELKEIDWYDVYHQYRPLVSEETTEDELFDLFTEMIRLLEDGHVYLVGGERRALSDGHLRNGRRNFDPSILKETYLPGLKKIGEEKIHFGRIRDQNIGYLRLSTLAGGDGRGDEVQGWITELEHAIQELKDTQGLILDLRSNGGGRAYNTKYVASFFAKSRQPFVVTRSRNGPRYSDFSAPRTWYAGPENAPILYEKPVVVLTNRFSFSAAEWLTLALRQYEHITHIGTNSGGGLAMFLPRELPNGWTYTISVQDTRTPLGQSLERVGIEPHFFVEISEKDLLERRDSMIERAIEILSQ